MDKTLLSENSARLFMSYRRKRGELSLLQSARFSFWLLKYALGFVDPERMAREALKDYRGTKETALRDQCQAWFHDEVQSFLTAEGRAQVEAHQARGDRIVIITSSTLYGTEPLARTLGVTELLCTRLEILDGTFTGELDGAPCFGRQKVEQARAYAKRHGFSLTEAYFYTDSITDLPLLQEVGHPVVINPDVRLKREARKRRWPNYLWRTHQTPAAAPAP